MLCNSSNTRQISTDQLKENLMSISINQTATIYDEQEQSYGWFSIKM